MHKTFYQRTHSHPRGRGIFYYHFHQNNILSATVSPSGLYLTHAKTFRVHGIHVRAPIQQFLLSHLSTWFHLGKPWLLPVWESYLTLFLSCFRKAAGITPKLPAAQCIRSPLMLAIVSAPTCLKFLRDTNMFQWCFNNSLIIAPDNNLHCIETLPVGGWVGGVALVTMKKNHMANRDTKGHELIVCSLLRNPCEIVTVAWR